MTEAADGILSAIPHRYPFIAVDRVQDVTPGIRAVGVKLISGDGPFSSQGYPQFFLVEAMAQLGAIASAGRAAGGGPAPGLLAAVSGVRFGVRPAAGDTVLLTVEFEARMGTLVRFRGVAKIKEEEAAEAVLTFSVPA